MTWARGEVADGTEYAASNCYDEASLRKTQGLMISTRWCRGCSWWEGRNRMTGAVTVNVTGARVHIFSSCGNKCKASYLSPAAVCRHLSACHGQPCWTAHRRSSPRQQACSNPSKLACPDVLSMVQTASCSVRQTCLTNPRHSGSRAATINSRISREGSVPSISGYPDPCLGDLPVGAAAGFFLGSGRLLRFQRSKSAATTHVWNKAISSLRDAASARLRELHQAGPTAEYGVCAHVETADGLLPDRLTSFSVNESL